MQRSSTALATFASTVAAFTLIIPTAWTGATTTSHQVTTAQHFSIAPSPVVSSTAYNVVFWNSCVSAGFCVAVGTQSVGGQNQPLIEQWNGSSWSIVPAPTPSTTEGVELQGVSCVSTSYCLAVGFAGTDLLVEQWNGTAWTMGPTATAPGSNSQFIAVSCTTGANCTAVGSYTPVSSQSSLIEHWNGTSWTLMTNPDPAGVTGTLNGVSCVGPSFCAAVGTGVNGASVISTLIKVWNGTTWTVMPSADPSGADDELWAATCLSVSFCMADGFASGPTTSTTLIEAWNGTSWSVSPSPSSPAQGDSLYGISCVTVQSCVAVGSANTTPGNSPGSLSNAEAVAWNGTTWSLVTAGNTAGATQNQYNGVSCVSGWACVVGGYSTIGPHIFTIVASAPIARPGYTMVATDGGIFNFSAPFYGSQGATPLNKPVVGMAEMPDGGGYYLVASDGGIFSHGNAVFHGSEGATRLNKPIVGMAN